MMIIGCDLHTRYQQIAMLDTETGELVERRLEHEATGHTHWRVALPQACVPMHLIQTEVAHPCVFLQGCGMCPHR